MADTATNLAFSEDDAERGRYPMADGLLDYFPNALAAVAEVSKIGSEKHNVGQPMHHARGKSTDHRNKIMRHLADTGLKDGQGVRHSAYVAWRALALLQEELEAQEGCPLPRGARPAECPVEAATMPELLSRKGSQKAFAYQAIAEQPDEFSAADAFNRFRELGGKLGRGTWSKAIEELAYFVPGTMFTWRKKNA